MIVASAATCYIALACVLAGADAYDPFTGADEVLRFSFENAPERPYDGDRDFDGSPDDWSRRKGDGFPAYVKAGIDRTRGFNSPQSLRVDVNGGQLTLYSPLNELVGRIDSRHAYVFQGCIRTQLLQNDAALLSVSFLNHKRQRVQRFLSQPVNGTHEDWQTVEIGPVTPREDVRFVVIGCHLVHGKKMDVQGAVWFDELWLGRLPQLSLVSNFQTHFKHPQAPILIESRVSGLDAGRDYKIAFRMEGSDGKIVDQVTRPLEADATREEDRDELETVPRPPEQWQLPPQDYGYYRVHASLYRDEELIVERETSFAVMDLVDSQHESGEFGWSVEDDVFDIDHEGLSDVAAQSGINWIKLPLWKSVTGQDSGHAGRVSRMLDQLVQKRIAPIGVLSDPPDELRSRFARDWSGVSELFTMPPHFWSPSLDQVVAKYSSHVRHWQLGGERDVSFVGMTRLGDTIESVRREINRIGRDAHVGLHWDWDSPLPTRSELPRTFLSLDRRMHSSGPLDDAELTERLRQSAETEIPRWVLLEPLGKSHPEQIRGADLVKRMVAAKIGGAQGIFAADVFDQEHGLLKPNGAPALLFLPWRTTALALQGTELLGSMTMPGGSHNYVFAREGEAVVILWNSEPATEKIYLGERVEMIDIWGVKRRARVDRETGQQIIPVTHIPLILRGCSEPVARWRQAVQFEKGRLPSAHAVHRDQLLGRNTFSQGVSGEIKLNLPRDWEGEPAQWTTALSLGEPFRLPTNLTLPANASLGKVDLSIDFDISAERQYKFRVYRPYEVGLDDVKLFIIEERLPDDTLRVEQVIVNNTDPLEVLNFECSLFLLGRKRKTKTVIKLERETSRKEFLFPNATELLDKPARLRVEQTDGPRVLNKQWVVGEEWHDADAPSGSPAAQPNVGTAPSENVLR